MFKIISQKERIQRAEASNKMLSLRNQELENALLEIAEYIAKQEAQDGETVSTQDK